MSISPARRSGWWPISSYTGRSILIGGGDYWQTPSTDERMYLIGYRYFLYEPWHWPVFVNHSVDAPYAKSVAFLDCIPLWALIHKAIATAIPPWRDFSAHAYLGLWHGLVYVLQPCFGIACLRALGHRSWRAGLVTAVFFVAIPWWIFRYGHAALSAHWIELWALYLYLRTPADAETPPKLGAAKLCQLIVASLVTPYHALMSFGIFAASVLRARRLRTALIWLPLGLAAATTALWFAGYFADETANRQWGFSVESANLLGWLVPTRSGLVGDASSIVNVLGTPWQWEGYAYLGIGYLVLFVLLAIHARDLAGPIRRHGFLLIIAIGFGVLSLSNHVYFGSHSLFSYPIPHVLHRLPDQFRSPGRFVWIPLYIAIVYLLHWALTKATTPRRFAILALLAALQVLDARGDWAIQSAWAHGASLWPSRLDHDKWRALIAAHQSVNMQPTYACIHAETPEPELVATEIELLVSERALPINGTYSTRPTRNCAVEEQAWLTAKPEPGTLYVVLTRAAIVAQRLQSLGASCASFVQGSVCSTNAEAIEPMR